MRRINAIIRYIWQQDMSNVWIVGQALAGPFLMAVLFGWGISASATGMKGYLTRYLSLGFIYLFFLISTFSIRKETNTSKGLMHELIFSIAGAHECIIGIGIAKTLTGFLKMGLVLMVLYILFNGISLLQSIALVSILLGVGMIVVLAGMSINILFTRNHVALMTIRTAFPALFVISGCFFPPPSSGLLSVLASLSPITHGISLSQYVLSEGVFFMPLISVLVLAGYLLVGYMITYNILKRC